MTSEEIMKKCQTGFGNYAGALDDANNLLAECYGHIGALENRNKAMLQELIECSYELQCLCGHIACKPCQRYGQLAEFIDEMKKVV